MRVLIKASGERVVLEDWTEQEKEAITKVLTYYLTPIVMQRLCQAQSLEQGGE